MKKYLSIVLSLAAVLPMFFACDSTGGDYAFAEEIVASNVVAVANDGVEASKVVLPKISGLCLNGATVGGSCVEVKPNEVIGFEFVSNTAEIANVSVYCGHYGTNGAITAGRNHFTVVPISEEEFLVSGTVRGLTTSNSLPKNFQIWTQCPNGDSNTLQCAVRVAK